jgi:hypothetical protein
MTTPPTAAELRELLLAGARADGNPSLKAAVHLLLFTEMPQARRFRQHVRIGHVRTLAYGLVHCAQVTDWRKLADDPELYPSGAELKFLNLAASFAVTGQPVDLYTEVTSGLDSAHARRLAEAILIATGADGYLTVAPASGQPGTT